MQRKKKNGMVWLEFDLLQLFPEVKHGIFLNPPLGDLDDATNPFRALDALDIKKGVKLRQCHKADLIEVKNTTPECYPCRFEGIFDFSSDLRGQNDHILGSSRGHFVPLRMEEKKNSSEFAWVTLRGATPLLTHFENYDGMVTQEKEVALLVRHADCQGTLFYDPIRHALAAVHCGWRGSVQNIYQKTIEKMKGLYGTDPADLIVCIGPSLGPEHAEFKNYKEELPKHFWDFQVRPTYFDFWEISRWQLEEEGIPEEQIEIAEICTYANDKDFFSYRRNQSTPHHGTLAALT